MNLQAKYTELRAASVSALRVISKLEAENAALKQRLEHFKSEIKVAIPDIKTIEAERDALRKALKEIRDQQWEENALDPQWASRIAKAALEAKIGE